MLGGLLSNPTLLKALWLAASGRIHEATGKRMDMGKSCVRFRRLDDLPLELIGEAIARTSVEEFIERYEAARAMTKRG